ncbi:MAG: thioredoxin [Betaproteobacteria bacterium]
MPVPLTAPRIADWTVVCLCAQWCRTCGGYRDDLRALAASDPQTNYLWLDIEDDAELVGELDVETFPTVLVLRGTQPLFYGPVLPQVAQVAQLLARLRAAGDGARALGDLPAEIEPLLDALTDFDHAAREPSPPPLSR